MGTPPGPRRALSVGPRARAWARTRAVIRAGVGSEIGERRRLRGEALEDVDALRKPRLLGLLLARERLACELVPRLAVFEQLNLLGGDCARARGLGCNTCFSHVALVSRFCERLARGRGNCSVKTHTFEVDLFEGIGLAWIEYASRLRVRGGFTAIDPRACAENPAACAAAPPTAPTCIAGFISPALSTRLAG